MLLFETITEQQISEMLTKRKEQKILIDESVVKFRTSNLNIDFSSPLEVPPSPTLLASDLIAKIILHSDESIRGKYNRFVIAVYAFGGKIFYTSKDSDEYEAHIVWS